MLVQKDAQAYNGSMLEPQAITSYFAELGFSPEVAMVYLALYGRDPMSVSEVSRVTSIERTRIHRLIDELEFSRLFVVTKDANRTLLCAAPLTNLQTMLSRREHEVKDQQDKLWVIDRLLAGSTLNSAATRVQFYQGVEGLRQMFWNQAESRRENVAILYEGMQPRTGSQFFKEWVKECNDSGVGFRAVVGQRFIDTQRDWYARHKNERLKSWQARFVTPDIFTISHSQITYGNVTSHYVWKNDEIFGVEMYNENIADTQRQLFEMLWRKCQPINDVTGELYADRS